MEAFTDTAEILLTGEHPLEEGTELIRNPTQNHPEHHETSENKLRQDPHIIPESANGEYNDCRTRFVDRHPERNIFDRGPHRKLGRRRSIAIGTSSTTG